MRLNKEYMGTIALSPDTDVTAGEFSTWTITFTAGEYGIDDGGTMVIAWKSVSDWDSPQFDEPDMPGYTTVSTTGQCRVTGRYAKFVRSFGNSILIDVKGGSFSMADDVLRDSLHTLSQLLAKHYGRKVVLLIDEYDVPLDKAFQGGYYDQMVSLIRGLFNNALKTNDNLQFAVLTGCLRISKESIFTGLNNLNVLSVTDVQYGEYFGFTDREVRKMLAYYGISEAYNSVKAW